MTNSILSILKTSKENKESRNKILECLERIGVMPKATIVAVEREEWYATIDAYLDTPYIDTHVPGHGRVIAIMEDAVNTFNLRAMLGIPPRFVCQQ